MGCLLSGDKSDQTELAASEAQNKDNPKPMNLEPDSSKTNSTSKPQDDTMSRPSVAMTTANFKPAEYIGLSEFEAMTIEAKSEFEYLRVEEEDIDIELLNNDREKQMVDVENTMLKTWEPLCSRATALFRLTRYRGPPDAPIHCLLLRQAITDAQDGRQLDGRRVFVPDRKIKEESEMWAESQWLKLREEPVYSLPQIINPSKREYKMLLAETEGHSKSLPWGIGRYSAVLFVCANDQKLALEVNDLRLLVSDRDEHNDAWNAAFLVRYFKFMTSQGAELRVAMLQHKNSGLFISWSDGDDAKLKLQVGDAIGPTASVGVTRDRVLQDPRVFEIEGDGAVRRHYVTGRKITRSEESLHLIQEATESDVTTVSIVFELMFIADTEAGEDA